jgi:hypothetical protein
MLAEGVVQQSTSRDQLIESTTDFIGRRESTAYRSLQIVLPKALVWLLETFYWASGGSSPASRPETRSRSPAASQAWFRRESESGRRTPDSWSCDKAW